MGCLCEPEKLKQTIVKFSDKIIDMEIIFLYFYWQCTYCGIIVPSYSGKGLL